MPDYRCNQEELPLRPVTGVTHKHYIAGAAVVTLSGSTWATQYLHRDHLGSVTAITTQAGTVVERFAYDPWGKRRFPDGAADPNATIRGDPAIAFATDRGFTNHEHLDGLGLIHMNGRIFDPTLARFTSADPHIQHPGNMQSFNRYSYVMNNPLIYTDPTGYFLKKIFKGIKKILKNPIVRAVAGVFAAVVTMGMATPYLLLNGYSVLATKVLAGVAGGFVGGFVGSGGDFKAALAGAVAGGAFGYVGGRWVPGTPQSYAGHAVVGCASSKAQGGNCARGAAAQLASKWATINTSQGNNLVAATVVGGTVSVIGGGKFANGAITGAAGYLFNQLQHQERSEREWEPITREYVPISVSGGPLQTLFDAVGLKHSTFFWAMKVDLVFADIQLEQLHIRTYADYYENGVFVDSVRTGSFPQNVYRENRFNPTTTKSFSRWNIMGISAYDEIRTRWSRVGVHPSSNGELRAR